MNDAHAFRAHAPGAGPRPPLRLPTVEIFSLGEVAVYLVPRPSLPTVSLSLSLPVGTVADPIGRRGRLAVTMDLVGQGTQRLDRPAWAEAKADIACSVSTWNGLESSGFGVSALHRHLPAAVDLLFEMIETPGLRERDLRRLIAQRKANLAQNCAVPGTLSRRVWPGLVFGTEHPYGRCTSQAQYDALGVSECAETFSGLSCRGARLYVAGSTTEPELRALFGDRVAAWAARVDVPTTNPTIEAIAATPSVLAFAEIPGAAQSQVLLGHPGPSRDVPDYEALELMAQILGGGFSSRINMKIREEKGQSYSARAGFSFHRQGSSFSAGAAVHREATAETLRDLAQEIARMRDELVTADELEREREGTLLGLPARFATAERVRDTIAGLVFHDLPLDYHAGYAQRLAQVQAPAVREAARAHLRAAEGGRCALVVGDGAVREAVQSAAEDLGFDAWHDIDAADAAGAMPGT